MNHKQRFLAWRKRMPEKTRYLVDCVLEKIVPEFEKHGFVWYPDFAGNDPREIGANEIALQRRVGEEWPTVQILFVPKGPNFQINFSALPEICHHPIKVVPRLQAISQYGPAYFDLRRGRWRDFRDAQFGFNNAILPSIRYWLRWREHVDSEVEAAIALLPFLFEVFDKELYREWIDQPFGYVNKHVFLLMSWKIRNDLEQKRKIQSM